MTMKYDEFNEISRTLQLIGSYLQNVPDIHMPDSSFLNGINLPQIDVPKIDIPPIEDEKSPIYSFNIPIELDIFSGLPFKVFKRSYGEQMSDFMKRFRLIYAKRLQENEEEISPKPKFRYSVDEENSQNIQMSSAWNRGRAMLYFSFEKNPKDSNFGMIWNDDLGKNYQSRSGSIYLSAADDVINESIDFMLRVFK